MIDIQRNILTLAILYPNERYLIFKELRDEYFTNEYRTIFKEMLKLYQNNEEIDPIVIVNNLGSGYCEILGGLSHLDYIKPNTKQYIKLLIDDYQRTKAKERLSQILHTLDNNKYKSEDIQNAIIDASKIFQSNNSGFESYKMREGLIKVLEDIRLKKEYYKTGFEYLDKLICIDKSDFIVIGGRPSSGKTAFATNIMVSMSKNYNVVFFSIETSREKIYQKIISCQSGINMEKLKNSILKEEDLTKFNETMKYLRDYKLEVVKASGMSVHDITTTALQKKANIIFIDYVQLIHEKGNNETEKITEISKKLHMFAQKEEVCVIALAQLSRFDNNNVRPTMDKLRSSGQLEQDADVILMIHNPSHTQAVWEEKQQREIIIEKNKMGITLIRKFDFVGSLQKFIEA